MPTPYSVSDYWGSFWVQKINYSKNFSPTSTQENTQFGIRGTICLPFSYRQGTTLGQYLFLFQIFTTFLRLDLQPVLIFSLVSTAAFLSTSLKPSDVLLSPVPKHISIATAIPACLKGPHRRSRQRAGRERSRIWGTCLC